MKKKEEILRRAVCLLCFADRCALEEKITNGVRHSLKEREEQRKIIIKWLVEKEYYNYLTIREKQIIETAVLKDSNSEIYNLEYDYECIKPMLWSLGLTDQLATYDDFVLEDLHQPLRIGKNHAYDEIIKSCKKVSNERMKNQRELSMLWYWRCLECYKGIPSINILHAIKNIFGAEYEELLQNCEQFNFDRCDFVVNGKSIIELSNFEIAKLSIISERRFYAFEWLCSDEEWGNIDLAC